MESTREVDVHELKRLDPRQFEQEHREFIDSIDWDWWDCIESEFKREMRDLNVEVDEITFQGLDWGHADANWRGQIKLASLMERTELHEQYPALHLAVREDGSWAEVSLVGRGYGRMEVSMRESTYTVTAQGIFAALDEEAWDELVTDQWGEADLQSVAEKFAQDKANELLKRLQGEWDYISSEEYFIESCEANEVKFEVEIEEE